jgi:hypothetical protein
MAATAQPDSRTVAVADCGAGLMLMALPSRLAALVAGGGARPSPAIVRLLGARMVAQGALQLVRPSTGTVRMAAVTEALHGTSMVGLAVLSARYRRPAVASAAVAAASVAAELAALHGRRR